MPSFLRISLVLILTSICFFGVNFAKADSARSERSRCVEQLSDSDLINELAYRLRTNAPPPGTDGRFKYSTSCDPFGTLKVLSTSMTTGESKNSSVSLNDYSKCTTLLNILNRKIAQNQSGALIAALCDPFGTLHKAILVNGEAKKDSVNLGTYSECKIQADALNQ